MHDYKDRTGQDRTGQDRTGQDRTGTSLTYLFFRNSMTSIDYSTNTLNYFRKKTAIH